MANLQNQIAAQLLSSKSLHVSTTWLNTFVSSAIHQRNVPLSALTQTALFRILNSDLRDSLAKTNDSSILPVDIFDPTVQERRLQGPIPVQVLDIEDIGSSSWSQIEAIERVERGEAIRGREIVRTVNVGEENQEASSNGPAGNTAAMDSGGGGGPHRMLLQDAAGTRAVAIEMQSVKWISISKLPIGAKLLLRNATVARGMILLGPESVTLLGGKIDAMDQAWKTGRKERLQEKITNTQSS